MNVFVYYRLPAENGMKQNGSLSGEDSENRSGRNSCKILEYLSTDRIQLSFFN